MKEINKKNPKRNGYYYSDGLVDFPEPFVSVTKVLQVINKPALMYWAGRECTKIALEDPSLSQEEVYSKFQLISKEATTRGKGVHNYYKNFILKEEIAPYPEHYEPYIKGIKDFFLERKPKHIIKNKIVRSFEHKYAGELDTLDEIDGLVWLLDLKTGGTYPEHELQLNAYEGALKEEGIKIDKKGILLLPGDGTYQIIPKNGCLEDFLKVKSVWEIMERIK